MRHLLYALPIGLATNQVGLTISISIVGQAGAWMGFALWGL